MIGGWGRPGRPDSLRVCIDLWIRMGERRDRSVVSIWGVMRIRLLGRVLDWRGTPINSRSDQRSFLVFMIGVPVSAQRTVAFREWIV